MKEERNIPELSLMIHEIEHKFGSAVHSSADFEALSLDIRNKTRQNISVSTLKRIWGSVTLSPTPRVSTLDVLARYLNYDGYSQFCDEYIKRNAIESGFFGTKCVSVSDLKTGSYVKISWAPDRIVTIKYLGDFNFEVTESCNSKLMAGDRFELFHIMQGYPLYISRILRNGKYTSSFIAGQNHGISTVTVV